MCVNPEGGRKAFGEMIPRALEGEEEGAEYKRSCGTVE